MIEHRSLTKLEDVKSSRTQTPTLPTSLDSSLSADYGLATYEDVGECPEHTYLHRRIDRAYTRMIAAKSQEWAHRWGDCFVTYVRARNAQRTPREVAELETRMGLR